MDCTNWIIPFGSQPIRSALARHSGVQVPVVSFHILPTGLHGLCFAFCFAGPLPLRFLSHGPLSRVHFGESLVIRLYSEIDHIHLSSEAQCVSHHLPQLDCHKNCQVDFDVGCQPIFNLALCWQTREKPGGGESYPTWLSFGRSVRFDIWKRTVKLILMLDVNQFLI